MTGEERDWHAEWEDERRSDQEDAAPALEDRGGFSLTRGVESNGRRKVYIIQTVQWIWDDGPYIESAYYGQSLLAFTTREKAAAYLREQCLKDPNGPQPGVGEVYLEEPEHETETADKLSRGELLVDA
jgi:hypothetical protein